MSAATISDEEVKRVKALGFLNNKGTDNFSGRVITRNGKLTAAQHRIIADAAEKFGNGIITYTIRQTIEVQGIPFENIEPFREYIKKEGLESLIRMVNYFMTTNHLKIQQIRTLFI